MAARDPRTGSSGASDALQPRRRWVDQYREQFGLAQFAETAFDGGQDMVHVSLGVCRREKAHPPIGNVDAPGQQVVVQ